MQFKGFDLEDSQKRALIFLREVGAIDNATHRQLNGLDVLRASADLRGLRDKDIVLQKGKGRSTYYISNQEFPLWKPNIKSTPVEDLSAPVDQALVHQLPDALREKVQKLPIRSNDTTLLEDIIIDLCQWKPLKSTELAGILGKSEKYLLRNYVTPLRETGKLEYTYPEMPNHPQQAYKTINNN